ncbi:hypothetical protein D3C73_1029080 [compost metagenome]
MANSLAAEALGTLRRQAPDGVVEGHVAGAIAQRRALLIGELARRRILPEDGGGAGIEAQEVVETPVKADAVPLRLVLGAQAGDGGGIAAERLALHVLVEVVVGQAQSVIGRCVPDQLGQHGVGGEVLRVGLGAGRADAARFGHVLGFLGVATGVGQQA